MYYFNIHFDRLESLFEPKLLITLNNEQELLIKYIVNNIDNYFVEIYNFINTLNSNYSDIIFNYLDGKLHFGFNNNNIEFIIYNKNYEIASFLSLKLSQEELKTFKDIIKDTFRNEYNFNNTMFDTINKKNSF